MVIKRSDQSKIIITSKKGIQGISGQGGDGGFGGTGGIGGTIGEYHIHKGDRDCVTINRFKNGDDLSKIKNLPGVTPPNLNRRDGIDGGVSVTNLEDEANSNSNQFTSFIPVEFTWLLLLKAESIYLNRKIDEALQILKFIYFIIEAKPGEGFRGGNEKPRYLPIYLQEYKTDDHINEWENIKGKVLSYINQISLGVDIFNNPANYVALIEPDFLANRMFKRAALVNNFEQTITKFFDLESNIKDRTTSLDQFIIQMGNNRNQITEEIKTSSSRVLGLFAELQTRYQKIGELKSSLELRQSEFQNAVITATHNKDCSFLNVIKFIGEVVTVVAGIVSGVGAVASAVAIAGTAMDTYQNLGERLSKVNPDLTVDKWKEVFEGNDSNYPSLVKQIKEIQTEAGNFSGNTDKFFKAFNQRPKNDNSTGISENLLLIKKEDFDKTIDSYINKYTEAKVLKEEFHNYIDFVDLTNQKRQDLTCNIILSNSLYNSVEQLDVEIKKMQDERINLSKNKVSAELAQSVFNLYYNTKWAVIKTIYLQQKALEFLDPENYRPISYIDRDINSLTWTSQNQRGKIRNFL